MDLDDERSPSVEAMAAAARRWAGDLGPAMAEWAGTASEQDLAALFRMTSALAADINARVEAAGRTRPPVSWKLP